VDSSVLWPDVVPHLSGFAHLATVGVDGRPHASKVAVAVDGERLWIATRASSKKARNIAATGRAALMWEPGTEAYVSADAELVDDLATRRRLWDSGLFPFPLEGFFGSADHPDFVLVRLTPVSAVVLSAGESGIRRDTWHTDHDPDRPV
jgi:general stress protein 26